MGKRKEGKKEEGERDREREGGRSRGREEREGEEKKGRRGEEGRKPLVKPLRTHRVKGHFGWRVRRFSQKDEV